MGHGICDNIARSCTIPNVTDETQVIAKQCHALLQQLRFAPEDVRGMGIQISKLADREMSSFSKNTRSLLDFVKPHADHEQDAETRDQPLQKKSPPNRHDNLPPLPKFSPQTPLSTGNTRTEKTLSDLSESLCLPSPSQIDPSVFDALPEDIRRSIEKSYSARNQRLSLNRIMKQEVWWHGCSFRVVIRIYKEPPLISPKRRKFIKGFIRQGLRVKYEKQEL